MSKRGFVVSSTFARIPTRSGPCAKPSARKQRVIQNLDAPFHPQNHPQKAPQNPSKNPPNPPNPQTPTEPQAPKPGSRQAEAWPCHEPNVSIRPGASGGESLGCWVSRVGGFQAIFLGFRV